MPRLFSALELPEPVAAHLAAAVSGLRRHHDELVWTPPERWHITLGFYGDHDDPVVRGARLRQSGLAGLTAPALRLSGCGRFPGVLWIGVHPDPNSSDPDDPLANDSPARRAMRALAVAADAGTDLEFRPHVTVARWRRGRVRPAVVAAAQAALADYRGPRWTPARLVLVRSDRTAAGPKYTVLDQVPLHDRRSGSGAPG